MKRVVITGMGIVSCLGNDLLTVTNALKTGKSGISRREEYEQFGFRSQIAGIIDIDLHDHIDRKNLRFMGNSAAYTCIAMKKALEDANLPDSMRSHERTGL
ncbi:MAG: beta-ketoacyl synthase N-terminal-like domain-containing protein, partial [Endozoicomonadaceae bacterium]|nr:beta-ketoacyl synthase N-terminal-like domain-containing protein [Endozoicomonadaceae bacterium]